MTQMAYTNLHCVVLWHRPPKLGFKVAAPSGQDGFMGGDGPTDGYILCTLTVLFCGIDHLNMASKKLQRAARMAL